MVQTIVSVIHRAVARRRSRVLAGGRVGKAHRCLAWSGAGEQAVQGVVGVRGGDAVEVGERDKVACLVVAARLGQRAIGKSLLDRLIEEIKPILRGVQVLVGQAGEVAEVVVAVEVGVVGRVGMAELDDGLQLIGGVVGVLDDVAGLIGDAGQIAGAVVGIDDRGRVGIGRLDQALAGVVLELRGVVVAVGAGRYGCRRRRRRR